MRSILLGWEGRSRHGCRFLDEVWAIADIVANLQEGASAGTVALMGVVVGKLRGILYELAKAYQLRISVICRENLVQNGRVFVLQEPRSFTFDWESG
jgi:hypothetical protein